MRNFVCAVFVRPPPARSRRHVSENSQDLAVGEEVADTCELGFFFFLILVFLLAALFSALLSKLENVVACAEVRFCNRSCTTEVPSP